MFVISTRKPMRAVLLTHWTGRRHTEVRVSRVKTGRYAGDMAHPLPLTHFANSLVIRPIENSPCRSIRCAVDWRRRDPDDRSGARNARTLGLIRLPPRIIRRSNDQPCEGCGAFWNLCWISKELGAEGASGEGRRACLRTSCFQGWRKPST